MRLHTSPQHLDYSLAVQLADVYLDGIKQTYVISADETEGTLTRYQRANGQFVGGEGDVVATETLRGAVVIDLPPEMRLAHLETICANRQLAVE